MWNRFSGKSNDSKDDDLPSQSNRRNGDERRHPARHSGAVASSNPNKQSSSRANDRDPRGFDSTSTSYSTTTRGRYPGAASASIASSYATASGNNNGEPYVAPGLVRNASLADQMPKSSSSRSSRDHNVARRAGDKKRDTTKRSDGQDQDIERRQKGDKREKKEKGSRRSVNGLDEELGTSRGPDGFPDQVASSGFSQFPGQYDGAVPGPNGATLEHPALSSHVQDQFPGQFPTQSSAPYRPPLAASEGGPGLAAEYYGDHGQSVAEQPGNRANTPSLIIGAEPHLQPALAVAAPPPEPSASGAVGAAASFFSGEFEEDEAASIHGQQNPSIHPTGQIRPNSNYHPSSAPIIPTIGGAAIVSAADYFVDSQTSSYQQRPDHELSVVGALTEYSSTTTHHPPSQTQDPYNPSISRPPKPANQLSQSSNIPVYAAGVAGAAGLAAAAYEHNHHSSNQEIPLASQYSITSMVPRHRKRGPFSALVDFFKDPQGVAQFEEYSQIIGVCRHCFAPGSSSRDAPRKHFYGRRRSFDRYGSSTRVDKDSRYYSSENEGRRKNKSWLATGLAGYGLAKIGESLFKEKDDLNDAYSVKTERFSPDGRDRRAQLRSRSKERAETGIIGEGKLHRKEPRDAISSGTKTTTYSKRRHSRTRSTSMDRETGLIQAAIGAALGNSVIASSSRRQSRSPQGTSVKSKHNSQVPSPERRYKTKKKKKSDRGFFSFGNGSSSSSSVDLAYTGSQDKHRSTRRANGKSRDDRKAEAALLGLGAAATALALNDGRESHRRKGIRELVRVKETKNHHGHGSAQALRSKKSTGNLDDELWESAPEEGYESMDSDLAYGAPVRSDSRASLSSGSSGTNKWSWRWGGKPNRRASSLRRKSSDNGGFPAVAGTVGTDLTGAATTSLDQRRGSAMDSTSSLPLQHVYPVPTSDPSRFEVGRESSITSSNRPVVSSRPEAVPLQHPRPIVPVSAAIYSSQTAYDHSYSAPTGPAVFSQTPYHQYPGTSDIRHSTHEATIPGSFPRYEQHMDDIASDFRIRRRDTFPARFGKDSISSSLAPQHRTSTKDDSSAVRFDLTEEQEEKDRRERRRKRKQDKELREAEEQEQTEKDRRVSNKESGKKPCSKAKPEEGHERFEKSWVGPAAGVVIGAVGAAAATDKPKPEQTREERRERRRRERELEDEEEAFSKSERRRRQRERNDQETPIKERKRLPDEIAASREYVDYQGHTPKKQDMSVWQEAASTKRSAPHESYGAFFTPLEFLNKSSGQVKITSANADADIDLERGPHVVTVEPKRIHDLSDSPAFSLADTDDKVGSSELSFPWQVPKLRLVEPTPPSTRGSTPIPWLMDAGDEGFEEPRKETSLPKVRLVDDQIHEHTIIAPKEDHDEFIEPPSGEISDTDPADISRRTTVRNSSGNETHSHNDSIIESSSASYGEDAGFAAALAASAEDAGFDPSIVIDNPTYRRRDSPPGSNKRNMPGGFDDGDELRLNKKEWRRERASGHQSQNEGPNRRDDDAIVQNIINQVEESESQNINQAPLENFDGEWENTEKLESQKAKKIRKGSEPKGDVFDASEIASKALDSKSRDVYESPTEGIRPFTSNSIEAESGRKSRTKAEQDSIGLDDNDASAVSRTEASKESKPRPKDERKGSIWDRVLGRSTGSLPQENGAKNVTNKAVIEISEEPKKKSRKSKEPESTRVVDDDHDSNERNSIGGTTPQISAQDLPPKDQVISLPPTLSDAGSVAQYLDHGTEPEQVEEKQPESFLGTRPEPPPPPDTYAESGEPSDPLETTSLPTSPHAMLETQSRRFSDIETCNQKQTTAALPSSPTAVPFHFRRPGRSSSNARSLSQTPLSSNNFAADLPPKQKTRPRSTEFKSSKDIRPLWLVERHRSHQEPTPDESYPSLPSSHTTSRSSSVHDLEGSPENRRGNYESNEAEHKPAEVEPASIISTASYPVQSDLLDSQQVTPTSSTFQDSNAVQVLPSSQASQDSSPNVTMEGSAHQSSSTLKSGVLGAIPGGSAAVNLNEAIQNNDPARQDLPREEKVDLEHGLNHMGLDTGSQPSNDDVLDEEEGSVPQKIQKRKQNKRKAGQFQPEKIASSVTGAVEARPSTISTEAEPLSPEIMRQIQEQDAQDTVDSWSPSALLSNGGKKSKDRTLVDSLPEESGPSINIYEPPRGNLKITLPAEGPESDILTEDMSREQVVDTMTAAAQNVSKDKNVASQSATAVVPEPFEILAEENRSESKDKMGMEGRKSLPQDDLPQDDLQIKSFPQDDLPHDNPPPSDLQQETLPIHDLPHNKLPQLNDQQKAYPQDDFPQINLPRDDFSRSQGPQDGGLQGDSQSDSQSALSSSALEKATFIEPFVEHGHGNLLGSPNANPASQGFDRGELKTAVSPPLELSPGAIPLPDGDRDDDLLDEPLGTLGPTSLDLFDDKEVAPKAPLDVPHIHDSSAITSGPLNQALDLPSQAEQVDADEYFAAPTKKKFKKGNKAKQNFTVEDNATPEIQKADSVLPNVVTSQTFNNNLPKQLSDEPAIRIPQENSQAAEDEWGGFTRKKKGKKGKKVTQNYSAGDDKTAQIQERQESLPNMPASEAPEDYGAVELDDEPAVGVSQPKTEAHEDGWTGFSGKKKGKKGKKVKPSFSVENNKATGVEEENNSLSKTAAPEYNKAVDLINEPAMHAPKSEVVEEESIDLIEGTPKPKVAEDDSAGFDSKQNDKMVEKHISRTLNLGPGPETEIQIEREPGTRDDVKDQISSLATTRTSQEVSAMLGLGETETSIKGKSKEIFPNESQVEHNSQSSSKDQVSGSDEWNPPVLHKPETSRLEGTSTEVHEGAISPDLGTPVAATNAAQDVQDILAGGNDAESATDARKETVVASTFTQETANDRPLEEDELNWDAPKKKKKSKKGKKNEALNEPETIEPAEVSFPPSATNTPLEQESAADRPIKEDELDRDAQKKKKKGKKGKKNEALFSDEPDIMEPGGLSSPLATMNRPPLEQEPAVAAINEAFLKQSKKEKKNKKAKRRGVSRAISEFRDEDEDEPTIVSTETPQDESKPEDLPATVGDLQRDIEPSVDLIEVPQDDNEVTEVPAITRDFRDDVEPSVVPTEFVQDDNRVEHSSALDRPSVISDVRTAVEPNSVLTEAPQDDDKVGDLPADGMPPVRADIGGPGDILEPEATPGIIQDNENERSREAPLEQEEDFMTQKRKTDEKKSEESKKYNASSLDDDEIPTLEDEQRAGTKDLEKDAPQQISPSSVDVVGEPGTFDQKIKPEQEKDFVLPTNEKDESKSKMFNAIPLDSNYSHALEDEPAFKTEALEEEAPKQPLASSTDAVKEPGTLVEGLPGGKIDREESDHARPFERKSQESTAQSEQRAARGFTKESETDSETRPLNTSEDLVVAESKRGEPMHGFSDSVSADATPPEIPFKAASSVTSSLEQSGGASEEITTHHANVLKGNIVPAVETDADFLHSLKPSKEDKERTNKARPWTSEEYEESRASLNGSNASEDPGERSIIPVSQDNESWSKQETSAQETESTEIVQLDMRPEEYQEYQGSVLEGRPSQARDDTHTMVEAKREKNFTNIKKGKEGEGTKTEQLCIPKPEEDRSLAGEKEPAWAKATGPVQKVEQASKEQPSDNLITAGDIGSDQEESAGGFKMEQAPILTQPEAIDDAKDEVLPWDMPVQKAKHSEKQHLKAQWVEPKIEDLSSSAVPGTVRETAETDHNANSVTYVESLGILDKDEPIPAAEIEMLDPQEQREYDDEYAKELERAVPNTEPITNAERLGSPYTDEPIPAVEVEMLDAQEQRDYNEEYAKELERQLSPLQHSERADSSCDEADTHVFPQSSIDAVMERLNEQEYRPLARPPALEDIIEESRSRSGSVQGSPVNREDNFSPLESTRKSKKGQKPQPVIWEDKTAMPPLEPKIEQGAKPSIVSSEGPGSWDTDAARPLDLEEAIDQRSLEDRTIASPTGDCKNADNKALAEKDWSGDYFAIQPSRPAEVDVGKEDTHEFRRALSTEPSFSSRGRSAAREPQTDPSSHPRDDAVQAYDQDAELGSLATDFNNKPRTEPEPAEKQVEDDSGPTPVKDNKSKEAKKKASAGEPGSQALGHKNLVDQPQDLETPTIDTLNERSPSRQNLLQPSHEDELSSVAEGRPTSRGRSGSVEGVAAAVGLGVGALAAESLSRRDSKNEGRRGKKAKEAGEWTDLEAETGDPESPIHGGETAAENQEHPQAPDSESSVRAWQHLQATSPRSPPSSKNGAAADHPFVGDLTQSSESPKYRDSAIYVSGSPMMSEEIPHHRAVRDSGYPATEASPVTDDEFGNLDDQTDLEKGATTGEREHVQHRPSGSQEIHGHQRSTSRSPFKISVEADSDYDVSASRPKERRKRSRRRSGAANDSDDSADSGFDIQRRRRWQAMAAEPREPPPVNSTTKDRSSALFGSSPSAREEIVAKSHDQNISPRYDPVRADPTWSLDRDGCPQQRSREASREGGIGNMHESGAGSTDCDIPTGKLEDTGTSLFGGPGNYEDGLLSPSRSPHLSESRGRRKLKSVSEDSPDGSPLLKKDERAVSDVGPPESGVKSGRMRSPPVEDDVAGEYSSTQDAMPGQAQPAAEEEKHEVVERSRSRNSDQLSTFSSRHSTLPAGTPRQRENEYRTASAGSMQSEKSIHAIIRTTEQVRSASGLNYHSSATGTPPLRRKSIDRSASGDLRGASKKSEAKNRTKSSSELEFEAELDIGLPSSSTYDPVTDKGKSRADMADVYEGWGDVRGQSPMSPTRPPSMRKRQSMQLLDLETRLDQIVSENRLLASQKLTAEKALQEQARDHSQERHAYEEALQEHKIYLTRKDSELSELKQFIEQLHHQAAHLREVNEGLASSRAVDEEHEQSYNQLRAEHEHTHEQWQKSTKELEDLKAQHTQLSTGMEDIVRHEVTVALEEKNLELRQLQSEFENAKQQVRNLQQQLLASRSRDDFVERDEDYFDSQCQSLCQHVQQWVLRFSKFSDMKACYLPSEIQDEKIVERMENAILDGSDVDDYLSDRVKRRDVFMSVVMTMIWEFIFTRYLFGMDREQRQKLKILEKTLQEVGPMSAVHKWRATTLTLLMKRAGFENQRATDTEAVVHEIYDTLATFLPPPSHLVGQIQESLCKVLDKAVDLSIEMRTQRAEYTMLPPLQPDYDTNGDLARKVYFSALTMNERSGATSSNEALQEQNAVVRIVLFPLVVKNEDDDEQIVVCPAQVLTAEGSKGKKTVRVLSAQGGRSEASFAGSDIRMEGGMI